MTFTPDLPSTEEVLGHIFESSVPPVPPQEQHIGKTLVSWWETDPGEVYIHAEGGTPDDRHYATTLVDLQLQPHGYRRASFDMDASAAPEPPNYRMATGKDHCGGCKMFNAKGQCWGYGNKKVKAKAVCDSFALEGAKESTVRTASWPDLMAKAKRLLQSGQVHLLRNGFNYLVGHVVGDHGEYDTEISRDDPNSRAITGWQCSCPWDQYAWQRTRKWKKFEGRPCSHVMALYWKGLSTPLDEDISPEQQAAMGTGQAPPAPAVPEHAPGREPGMNEAPGHHPEPNGLPRSFGPEGDILQGDQLQMPPEAMGGPPGPAQAPLAPPPTGSPPGGPSQGPTPSGVIPPFPGEQMEMEWAGPGSTPGGGQSPPGAYSVPGAKPPVLPNNPLQNPGTYSHVTAAMTLPQQQRYWQQLQEEFPHQPNPIWQDPRGWTVQEHTEPNAVAAVGNMMANCWQSGITPKGMAANLRIQMDDPTGATYRALHDPYGIPRVAFYWQPGRITLPMGHGTNDPKPEHAQKLWEWASSLPQMPTTDGYSMENGWPQYSPARSGYDAFLKRNRLSSGQNRKPIDWWHPRFEQHVMPRIEEQTADATQIRQVMMALRNADELAARGAPGALAVLLHELYPLMPDGDYSLIEEQWLRVHPQYRYGSPEYEQRTQLADEAKEFLGKTAADLQPPQVVKLKKDVIGIAKGPVEGQYGDGQYREIPALKPNGQPTLGEVRHQDPTTGWIEVIFPLDQSGPHEPYSVQVFCDPGDIEPSNQSNAFIRRHR